MKTNYATFTNEQLSQEQRRLHRKLIWPNLVVLILSLVAAITLLFGQTLRVSVHIDREFGNMIAQSMAEQGGGSEEETQNIAEQYAYLFKDVDMQLTVAVKPLELFAAGFSEGREGLRTLLGSALGGVSDAVDELSTQVLPAMISLTAASAAGVDFSDTDLDSIDTQLLTDTVTKLSNGEYDEAEQSLRDNIDGFLAQFGVSLTDEERESIIDSYNSIVDQATKGKTEDFSFVNIIAASGDSEGEGSEEGGMGDMLAILSDPGAFADQMDEETFQTVQMVCKGVSAAMFLFAGLWAILALFALLHIFLPNKKLGMWYVKLLCWLPCVIFFIAPKAAATLLPNFLPAESAQMVGMLSSVTFGSMTIVSGICLLVLWLVSIFWCHPVKKRIKRCKQALKMRRATN